MKRPSQAFLVTAGILLLALLGELSYVGYREYRLRQYSEICRRTELLADAGDLQELGRFVDSLSSTGQWLAIGTLSQRSDAPAKRIVVARAHSDDPALRRLALMYILDFKLAEYKDIAISSLDDSSGYVRKVALVTVCALKCSEARGRVTTMAEQDPDPHLRAHARCALRMLPPPGKASAPNPSDGTGAVR